MTFASACAAAARLAVCLLVAAPEMNDVVALIPEVTDASFSDVPSPPFSTLPAAVTNDAGNGDVSPRAAAVVLVVKSIATAILFRTSIASAPVAPLAIASAAAPSPTAP